jgi:Fur family peroxide stress response transcriptional regulator
MIIIIVLLSKERAVVMEIKSKKSKQRDALLAALRDTNCHPTALWLYDKLRIQFPQISLATVYRNLNLLHQTGEIIKIDIGDGTEHYDGAINPHCHFVCDECRSIIDVPSVPMQNIDQNVAKMLSADIRGHSLVFYGKCKSCRE